MSTTSDTRTRRLSQERLNKRRISLQVQSTNDALHLAQRTKKGVHFPLGVLMQLAVTNGDQSEIKQLVEDFGHETLNVKEPSGLTPVMRAIFEGESDALKMLIDAGADISLCDPEDWNVLHVAAAMDDYEAAELILCSYKDIDSLVNRENMLGERPIDLAESLEMARLLLHANLTGVRRELECKEEEISISRPQIENDCAVIQLVRACML